MPGANDPSPPGGYTRTELVALQAAAPGLSPSPPRGGTAVHEVDGWERSWRNRLIWGDNKLVMASLLKGDPAAGIEPLAGKIDLIYIDPPFDTGADFSFRTQLGDEDVEKEPSILEQVAYRDTWGRGTDSYLHMMYGRLSVMRDLLSPDGSIYVHLDDNIVAYVRLLFDEVFGAAMYTPVSSSCFVGARHASPWAPGTPGIYKHILRTVDRLGEREHARGESQLMVWLRLATTVTEWFSLFLQAYDPMGWLISQRLPSGSAKYAVRSPQGWSVGGRRKVTPLALSTS